MVHFHLMKNESECFDEDCRLWFEEEYSCNMPLVDSKYEALKKVFDYDTPIYICLVNLGRTWTSIQEAFGLPGWVCAFSFENKVVIKTPDLWQDKNIGTFEETLVHEMVHCFIAGACQKPMPLWLVEALAIYMSGQGKYYRQICTKGVQMDELGYESPSLYDLSISRLNEILKVKDIGHILQAYISGGVEGETKYSKSGGNRY